MTIVSFVCSRFRPIGNYKKRKVPTGKFKKTLFGQSEIFEVREEFVQTGWSDTEIDIKQLSSDLQKEVNRLNREGYKVGDIQPVISGKYRYDKGMTGNGGGYGYGYGYSYTEGFLIVASKAGDGQMLLSPA